MKALLLLSLTLTLAACSTTNTTTTKSTENNESFNESLTLEQIAEKSQRLTTDLKSDLDLLIPESVNNSHRLNGKDTSTTTLSTNDIKTSVKTTK